MYLSLKIGDRDVELPFPPKKFVQRSDKVIVLMEASGEPEELLNRNIQAFDLDGDLLWTIRHPGWEDRNPGGCSFTRMWWEDDVLRVRNFYDTRFEVDIETGEVQVVESKRF